MHRSEIQSRERRTGDSGGQRDQLPLLLLLLSVCSLLFLGLAVAQFAGASTPQQPPIQLPSDAGASAARPGNASKFWIVGGIPGQKTSSIATSSDANAIPGLPGSFRVPRSKARELAARMSNTDRLVYAEPDVEITRSGYPTDALMAEQWWLERIVNTIDTTPPEATSKSPLIALVEESLDPLHPDLVNARLAGAISLGPSADWHGTAIAGIIGSPGEMKGIRGVWPGARMRLFPSGLTCATASKAVVRAANRGAAVINMSYTFPSNACFTHFRATQYANKKRAVLVASAGNYGATTNAPVRPANDPHVLSVGAVDDTSTVADFSNRNRWVDLVAPGAGVLAPTVAKPVDGAVDLVTRGWARLDGTSFSAPMVSAAAGWIRQVRPGLSNLQVQRLITDSAADLGPAGRDNSYGEGMLNIESALAAPNPPIDPMEPNDDIQWLDGSQLGSKAPFFWRPGKGKRKTLEATLSKVKDPADVYRVLLPARGKVAVNVNQIEGDVAVSALKPTAKSIRKPGKNLIVRSNRPYPKTEGIMVQNRRNKPRVIWLAITPSASQSGNDSAYRLTLTRK